MNTQHANTNTNGNFVPKIRFQMLVLKIYNIQIKNLTQLWYSDLIDTLSKIIMSLTLY